jgi:hypothetical protein
MSHSLGEVGRVNVAAFCGPEGRRESYQIDGPYGYVQFSWEEWSAIKKLIRDHHVKRIENGLRK